MFPTMNQHLWSFHEAISALFLETDYLKKHDKEFRLCSDTLDETKNEVNLHQTFEIPISTMKDKKTILLIKLGITNLTSILA